MATEVSRQRADLEAMKRDAVRWKGDAQNLASAVLSELRSVSGKVEAATRARVRRAQELIRKEQERNLRMVNESMEQVKGERDALKAELASERSRHGEQLSEASRKADAQRRAADDDFADRERSWGVELDRVKAERDALAARLKAAAV